MKIRMIAMCLLVGTGAVAATVAALPSDASAQARVKAKATKAKAPPANCARVYATYPLASNWTNPFPLKCM